DEAQRDELRVLGEVLVFELQEQVPPDREAAADAQKQRRAVLLPERQVARDVELAHAELDVPGDPRHAHAADAVDEPGAVRAVIEGAHVAELRLAEVRPENLERQVGAHDREIEAAEYLEAETPVVRHGERGA